jgi:hypothetical protein
VSAEQSWGTDTVAFGRAREVAMPDPPPRRRPPRGSRRSLLRPANRTIAVAAVGIVALVALIAVLGGGSGSPSAPIREVADPAPPVAVKPPLLPRRREQRHDPKSDLKRQPKGQLEGGEREPQKTSPTHEQAAPELKPTPVAEAEPEPAPVAEAEPEPIAEPAPAQPTPTPPATEFGL